MKPYQERMEEYIHAQTMVLWEKGLLPKRRPWTGDSRVTVFKPSGLIKVAEPGDLFEDWSDV